MTVQAQQKGLELVVRLRSRRARRRVGDQTRIQQVLTNLVGNALKFTEAGHVRVAVAEGSRRGAISHLVFSVADTGIGIPADQHAAIFEAFKPGGRLDDAEVRGHGPGPGHLVDAGAADGGAAVGRERAGLAAAPSASTLSSRSRIARHRSQQPGVSHQRRCPGRGSDGLGASRRRPRAGLQEPQDPAGRGQHRQPARRVQPADQTGSPGDHRPERSARRSSASRGRRSTWCSWTCRCPA